MVKRANEVTYSVNPNPLEMHADKVSVKLSVTFPKEYFEKKAIIVGTPVLIYDGKELELPAIELQGEDAQENYTVINYKKGGSYTYENSFNYKGDMRFATLELKLEGRMQGQSVAIPVEPNTKIADGVKTTPELVEKGLEIDNTNGFSAGSQFAKLIFAEGTVDKNVNNSKKADIHYLIQKSNIRTSEKSVQDVKDFETFAKAQHEDLKLKLLSITLKSYASPDGDVILNENLAQERNRSARKFIETMLKNLNVADYNNNSLYTETFVKEDWDGFKAEMEASNIQDKDMIVRVLKMYSDPVRREVEIKKISSVYPEIADRILPKLRRSEFSLKFEPSMKPDDKILQLAQNKPAELTQEELLYAASLTNKLDEKKKIFENYKTAYANDWKGANNLGVVAMYQNDIDNAKTYFEEAKRNEDNATVQNNLGVVALAQGNIEDAEDHFNTAVSKGLSSDEVNYNLGVISIKKGEYDKAIQYFGSSNTFNAALAYLLSGNYSKPKTHLDNMSANKDAAIVFYLKAIVDARNSDKDGALKNLKAATKKDASLKKYAKQDWEFGAYFSDSMFTSIVN